MIRIIAASIFIFLMLPDVYASLQLNHIPPSEHTPNMAVLEKPSLLADEEFRSPIIALNEKKKKYPLGSSIEILENDLLQLNFKQISSGRYDGFFYRSHDSIPNFGDSGEDLWVRFRVATGESNTKWLLEFANWYCHYIELYIPKEGGGYMVKESGLAYPFYSREVQDKNYVFELDMSENDTSIAYLHLKNISYLPIIIWEESAYYSQAAKSDIIWSFYFAIFFTMILYNSILFFSVRDVSYLFYVIYILSFACYQFISMGYGFIYFFPDNVGLFDVYAYFFNGASCAFALLTAWCFLDIPHRLPSFVPAFKAFIILSFAMLPLGLLNQENVILRFIWILPFFSTFMLLLAGIIVAARGYRPARYFIWGWSLLSVAVILYYLKSAGVLPVNYITQYGVRAASALEVILFSLGLADRINVNKKEKEQAYLKLKTVHQEAEKLHEIDQLKSRFFANISHEFRTPLTLILGPLQEMIAKSSVMHPRFQQLKLMQQNTNRLLLLLNQLLDISKLEAGAMKIRASKQSLISFLKQNISSFASLAESRQMTLELQGSGDDIQLYLDTDKMQKVIFNLISNAFKFTPDKGVIRVKAQLIRKNADKKWPHGHVSISVEDNGQGIPADQLAYIFDRFYQVDNSMAKGEGAGIGLALTKELVELHHGTVQVASEYGKGTCFTINLPMGIAHLQAGEMVNNIPISVQTDLDPHLHVLPVPGKMCQKSIKDRKEKPLALIVEDNTSLRHYILHLFENQYFTLEAENGKTGYEIARKRLPDLIVSDLMMPTMDGIEFCRLVKADKATCCIPFLLLTARASGENKLAGLESGADDYILKPFDNHELMVRAANLVASRQKFKETARQQLDKVRLGAFINAQEQERSKIASELHDSIGQMLALVKINLARIDASLQASPAVVMEGMGGFNDQEESLSFTTHNGEFMEIFNETLQLLDETCMELRRISHNMMSPELEHINLEEALKNLLWKSLKNQQVVYEINCYKIPEKIDRLIKINLYRIVQEAMANIIRHAKASKITVQLMGGAEDMNLLIEDNGRGFNLETNRDGIGLKNIRSRVELMKGSLDIDSVHGRGTIININVPWES